LLFAPLSNVGAVSFDKDAVYIDIGRVNYTKKENLDISARTTKNNKNDEDDDDNNVEDDNDEHDEDDEIEYDADEPAGMLKNLQDVQIGVDEKMEQSTLRIFKGSQAVIAGADSNSGSSSSDDEDNVDSNDDRVDDDDEFNPNNPSHALRQLDATVGDNDSDDSDNIVMMAMTIMMRMTKRQLMMMITNRLIPMSNRN
jgi:ribosome biogenesis protein BMS1